MERPESKRHQTLPGVSGLVTHLVAVLLSAWTGLFANDVRDEPCCDPPGVEGPLESPAQAAAHVGSSPFAPPEEGDTRFVVDSASGLDTGCTFRRGGPLVIDLPVKRFAGPVGPDGKLLAPNSRLVSPKAKLRLPVYDIDVSGGSSGTPPEVDRIYFNGVDLGALTGDNNVWKLNSFDVPISLVNFPAAGSSGSPPTPAVNRIEIHIDTASPAGEDNWCMSVDWVELEFSAVAPVFLVHGTNAQSDTWDPDFTAFFGATSVPWSNSINLEKNGAILANGQQLAERLLVLAREFGAKKCHLVAHSKGGLDCRAFLNNRYDPEVLEVLSLYTISTPHHGTIVSDIIVAARAAEDPTSSDPDLEYLIDNDYSFLDTPQEPAIGNQTTASMAAFNAQFPSIPAGIRFYNYGADADLNNNGSISEAEAMPLLPSLPFGMTARAGTAMYRAIGNAATISVTVNTEYWGLNTYTSIEIANANSPFAQNDLTVSTASAQAPGGTYLGTRDANHSSIKSVGLASEILNRILTDFPNL